MEGGPSAAHVLNQLCQSVNVSVTSNKALVGSVERAASADDKRRWREYRQKAEAAKRDNRRLPQAPPDLRRKQGLRPLPSGELGTSVELTYIDVLHYLARGLSLTQRGAGRGLAEHWASLKYVQAVQAAAGSFLRLSAEGKRTAKHYKTLQSEELGQAFALALAERVLRSRYPDHSVSIIHSDTVLRAGWALNGSERRGAKKSGSVGYRYRPHYLAEVWKPSQPSLIFPIACKGHHSNAANSHRQLASSAAYVDGLHIGAWNETPGFVFSTALPLKGPLSIRALHALGDGGWLAWPNETGGAGIDTDQPVRQRSLFPGIERPREEGRRVGPAPGCQVKPANFAWFQHVLARTDAAGLTAFAGAGKATARLLTERQGREFFTADEHAVVGSVQDAKHKLLGEQFAGTDHVFRLNGARVEAFSGVQKDIFQQLAKGGRGAEQEQTETAAGVQTELFPQLAEQERAKVAESRSLVHSRRGAWPQTDWDKEWGGPVSIHQDGTVLAIRVVNVEKKAT